MVPGAWHLREGERVTTPLVVDRNIPLFDVDIGRTILTHCTQLDQVAIGHVVSHRVEHVEVAKDIIRLGIDGVTAVDHRVGRSTLLAIVDDRFGLEPAHHWLEEAVVTDIAHVDAQTTTAHGLPDGNPLLQRDDRHQTISTELIVVTTASHVIDESDFMTTRRQVDRGGPSEIAIPTKDQDTHRGSPHYNAAAYTVRYDTMNRNGSGTQALLIRCERRVMHVSASNGRGHAN